MKVFTNYISNVLTLGLVIATMLLGCEKEESEFSEKDANSSIDEKSLIRATAGLSNTINKAWNNGAQTYHANIGYSPVLDQVYPSPFTFISVQEDNSNNFTNLGIEIVRDYKELTNLSQKKFQKSNTTFGINGASGKTTEELIGSAPLKKETITVAARLNMRINTYYSNGSPIFISSDNGESPAELLEQQRYLDFFTRYGTTYIERQDLGADVYYFHSYTTGNIGAQEKENLALKIKDYLNFFYGNSANPNLTPEEQQQIRNNLVVSGTYSSIPSFAPQPITDFQSFENEKNRLFEFLQANPGQASTVGLSLLPYSSATSFREFIKAPALEEFNRQKTCFSHLEQWQAARARAVYVSENAVDQDVKDWANAAISEANAWIDRARSCSDSHPPGPERYSDLLNEFNAREGMRRKLAVINQNLRNVHQSGFPLYFCHYDGSSRFFINSPKEIKKRIEGYDSEDWAGNTDFDIEEECNPVFSNIFEFNPNEFPEYPASFYLHNGTSIFEKKDLGISFSLLGQQIEGALPIYYFKWKKNGDKNRRYYTTNINAVDTGNWELKRTIGFGFENALPGSIPLYRMFSDDGFQFTFTTDEAHRQNLKDNYGFVDNGIVAWVFPPK